MTGQETARRWFLPGNRFSSSIEAHGNMKWFVLRAGNKENHFIIASVNKQLASIQKVHGQNIPENIYWTKFTGQNIPDKTYPDRTYRTKYT